ncbi:Na+/H+ antiporter NhaA [Frigidibacter sp. MR17.24]|uniref:Na+/H+ antiporter NhaA n=1 Tax=Frigidibacter sp. MR17.24 TaxID=3127345 RepID=UPI003FA5DC70
MSLMTAVTNMLKHDAAGGIALMISAALAFIVANSALQPAYDHILHLYASFSIGESGISLSLLHWINDALMAVFFFLVGLELKREMLEGKLKKPADIVLPGMAAVGGMVVPALIYVAFNFGSPETIGGWAIPAATDIAFAVGVMALLGKRVPASLKIFLLTLAILDDMGAILIIALFYTAELNTTYLLLALLPIAGLWALNRRGAHRIAPAILLGVVLWYFVLMSGIHATLAGVVTAFFIPLKDRHGKSPLHSLEHGLSPYVFFLIVPVFAFANAGVVLSGMSVSDLFAALPLGIAAGLFLGKQIGVFGVTWLMVKMGLARIPAGANWMQVWGVACLAGIGFTMSLFIGSLSFSDAALMNEVRLGVLLGSFLSAVVGYVLLRTAPPGDVKVRDQQRYDSHALPG